MRTTMAPARRISLLAAIAAGVLALVVAPGVVVAAPVTDPTFSVTATSRHPTGAFVCNPVITLKWSRTAGVGEIHLVAHALGIEGQQQHFVLDRPKARGTFSAKGVDSFLVNDGYTFSVSAAFHGADSGFLGAANSLPITVDC